MVRIYVRRAVNVPMNDTKVRKPRAIRSTLVTLMIFTGRFRLPSCQAWFDIYI